MLHIIDLRTSILTAIGLPVRPKELFALRSMLERRRSILVFIKHRKFPDTNYIIRSEVDGKTLNAVSHHICVCGQR